MVAMRSMRQTKAERDATEDGDGMMGNGSQRDGVPLRLDHDHIMKLGMKGPLPHGTKVEMGGHGEVTESGTHEVDGEPRHHMTMAQGVYGIGESAGTDRIDTRADLGSGDVGPYAFWMGEERLLIATFAKMRHLAGARTGRLRRRRMDDQIDPGDNFFGINLADCVTVPIMDSIVGLKAANAHLTRQLAAQALAHAEQMEGLKTSRDTAIAGLQRAVAFGEKMQSNYQELERFSRARIVTNQSSCDEYDEMLAAKDARIAELDSELAAMRVTPATQPTDAQQTASDVKVAPERRPDGTLKPAAKAWEAPKRLTDVRRIGG